MVQFSKYPTSWKIVLETMIGNVVISVASVFMFIVISKKKKILPYEEWVGTTERITL